MDRRLAAAGLALSLTAASLMVTGCAPAARCFPEPLKATPASVAAGGAVTISSAAARCDLGYPDGHTYSIVLWHRGIHSESSSVRVAPDGAFGTELTVPADFPHGEAFVVVSGSTYDDCADTGSCAGYSTTITVE